MQKIKLPAVQAGSSAARLAVGRLFAVLEDRSVTVDEGVAGATGGCLDNEAVIVAFGSRDRTGLFGHGFLHRASRFNQELR